ncbi:6-phosphogluconolactonase [candidate division KSB1 bacterium]|nr:6-phosphogluconolactonase [candidate division KSB1 bacterium]
MKYVFDLIVAKDRERMVAAAACDFFVEIRRFLESKECVSVALAGGSTPRDFYRYLAAHHADRPEWRKMDFFWSDERTVEMEHPDSNAGLALRELLNPLGIDKERIFAVPVALEPFSHAARSYENTLRKYFKSRGGEKGFDLLFLGVGQDGHTASLFPDSEALKDETRWVADNWVEKLANWRITFTLPLINRSKVIFILASGEDKAEIIGRVWSSTASTDYPIQRVAPREGRICWYLDRAAAAKIPLDQYRPAFGTDGAGEWRLGGFP